MKKAEVLRRGRHRSHGLVGGGEAQQISAAGQDRPGPIGAGGTRVVGGRAVRLAAESDKRGRWQSDLEGPAARVPGVHWAPQCARRIVSPLKQGRIRTQLSCAENLRWPRGGWVVRRGRRSPGHWSLSPWSRWEVMVAQMWVVDVGMGRI